MTTRKYSHEEGQTLALVAAVIVALVAMLALIIDLGNVYVQRRFMQNAADTGALAGARAKVMGSDDAGVQAAVQDYAVTRNGATTCSVQVVSSTVQVIVSKTTPTYFAGVVGVHQFTVQARAEAGLSAPGSWSGGLLPIAVDQAVVTTTHSIDIWDDEKAASNPALNIVAGGQRGWMNFNGGPVGDTELVDWCAHGYPGTIRVGDWVNGTPGTKASALQTVSEVRTGTIIFVPIYDTMRAGVNGSGSLDYHVVGFGAFYVEFVKDTGSPKFVRGRFQRYVAAQEAGGVYTGGVAVIGMRR